MELDPDGIGQALKLVADGTKAADGALTLVKRFRDLMKGDKPPKEEDVRPLLTDLMEQLNDAKSANIDLRVQLNALREKELLKAQAVREEFDRYELVETALQNLVLRLKEEHAGGQPRHFICVQCREDGIKSILQGDESTSNDAIVAMPDITFINRSTIPSKDMGLTIFESHKQTLRSRTKWSRISAWAGTSVTVTVQG
ncbi:MAG: hypothetical protein R3D34_06920 [Nitratireductor sp.]